MTVPLNRLLVLAAEMGDSSVSGAAGQARPPGPGTLWSLMPFVLIFVAFFWVMSRSQKKRERRRQEMLDAIRPKDDIITVGGIVGRVLQVREEEILLRVDPDKDVKITIAKSGIGRKVGEEELK